MSLDPSNWAIVLAGGDGTRLGSMTRDGNGRSIPKQFCSLGRPRTLLGDTFARAAHVVPKKRIVAVVAEQHRAFWRPEAEAHPEARFIEQPENRGTAAGVLLPLLHVLEGAPDARVVILPADHHVDWEDPLEHSLRLALSSLDEIPGSISLLGIIPDSAETSYGWIVPAEDEALFRRVERFVEKPPLEEACRLMARGGVWNGFLLAAEGRVLVQLYEQRLPGLLSAMRDVFAAPPDERPRRLAEAYERLETHDFSRDVLQGSEEHLRLILVPPCGWTDLGTPARVAACVHRTCAPRPALSSAILDLAAVARPRVSVPENAFV